MSTRFTATWVVIGIAVLGLFGGAFLPHRHDRVLVVGLALMMLGGGSVRVAALGWIYGEVPERWRVFTRRQEPFYYWVYVGLWGLCGLFGMLLGALLAFGGVFPR